MPLVSVVIPTHNRADMLDKALRSVFAQTYRDFEVIIVDDGSTDHTSDVVSRYSTQAQYTHQENQGRSSARNTGIRAARGAYVAFLDDDDIWLPCKLELQVNTLVSRPDAAVVYGSVYVVNGGIRCLVPKEPPPPEVLLEQLLPLSWESFWRIPAGASVVMVRTDALAQTGLFNPAFEPFEDWELWLRLAARGLRFVYVPDPVAEYRMHGGNTTWDLEQTHAVYLMVLEKILASPETPQHIRARRRHYLSCAWIFVGNGWYSSLQLAKAWRAWLRGVQMDPSLLTLRLLLLMGRTLCGPRILGWARQVKHALLGADLRPN